MAIRTSDDALRDLGAVGPARANPAPRSRPELERIVAAAAAEFGADLELMRHLAACESSWRPDAVGDGGRAVGLFQFHAATWYSSAARLGYLEDLRADPVAASRVTASKIAREGAWAWSCAR